MRPRWAALPRGGCYIDRSPAKHCRMSFIQAFDQHGAWRKQFALRLKLLSEWLADHDLMEPGIRECSRPSPTLQS